MYLLQYCDDYNIKCCSTNRYRGIARYAAFHPSDKTAKTLIKTKPGQRRRPFALLLNGQKWNPLKMSSETPKKRKTLGILDQKRPRIKLDHAQGTVSISVHRGYYGNLWIIYHRSVGRQVITVLFPKNYADGVFFIVYLCVVCAYIICWYIFGVWMYIRLYYLYTYIHDVI